jgi:hypothetical protein
MERKLSEKIHNQGDDCTVPSTDRSSGASGRSPRKKTAPAPILVQNISKDDAKPEGEKKNLARKMKWLKKRVTPRAGTSPAQQSEEGNEKKLPGPRKEYKETNPEVQRLWLQHVKKAVAKGRSLQRRVLFAPTEDDDDDDDEIFEAPLTAHQASMLDDDASISSIEVLWNWLSCKQHVTDEKLAMTAPRHIVFVDRPINVSSAMAARSRSGSSKRSSEGRGRVRSFQQQRKSKPVVLRDF